MPLMLLGILLLPFGKGFAIGLVVLVSLTIFAIFVSYATISDIVVLTLKVFIGLLVGAMLPLGSLS